MKYLNSYKQFESNGQNIIDMINDVMVDLKDEGFTCLVKDSDSSQVLRDVNNIYIDIQKSTDDMSKIEDRRFAFKDIIPTLNELISQLSSNYYELEYIQYSLGTKWYEFSMDPIDGCIEGDKIITLKHPSGKDVSKYPVLKTVQLGFYIRK